MRKEAARMIRPALRPFLIGTVLALVLLGSTVRADATRPEQKMLAPAQHMLTARSEAVDAAEATLPTGFQESTVFEGLTFPTNFRFSPDGRVFVAEKSGIIKVFDSLADTTPTVFADLRTQVDDYWDRGLLGLALDPDFPASPYIYVLYTYDAGPGQVAPIWKDVCPTPPGPTTDGCVVTGHLARLTASGDTMTGEEQVLITDWCQQFPSHSVGDLQFGPDGALYVSAGEGANFGNVDVGQWGGTLPDASHPITPKNPCGDPPGDLGGAMAAPSAEGGALRSQSLNRVAGPAVLNGTVIRVDPSSGDGMPDNPLAASSDENARRIVAEGLRNPFRFALRPGTNDLWIGDVGWRDWEEIDHDPTPTKNIANFGWPCYEGNGRQPSYEGYLDHICTELYSLEGSDPPDPDEARAPYFTYNHAAGVVGGDGCTTGSSSVAGLAFYASGTYPSSYAGALFFADHSRNCIWVMPEGADGLPDPSAVAPFISPAAGPVDLEIGPGGDLFYAGYDDGTIRRIQYFSANQPPIVVATASPQAGPTPLKVTFDAAASHDPDGDPLTFSWDLDGDGTFGDSASASTTYEYDEPGTFHPSVRVSDDQGGTTRSSLFTLTPGDTPPVPVIDTPVPSLTWAVGDDIEFSGHASDAEDGTEPAARLSWSIIVHHCPSDCHTHNVETIPGVVGGSFSAPDHEYPSFLELKLTATDANGLSASSSVDLDPKTVALTLKSKPAGLQLAIGTVSMMAPFTHTVIVGSANSINAAAQVLGRTQYTFSSWSDGGAAAHNVTAPTAPATYTATFVWPEHPPVAEFVARPSEGRTPLTVRFNAKRSMDPDGDKLKFSWDLNGNGVFGDSRMMDPKRVYHHRGRFKVRLRVSDGRGGMDTASMTIRVQRR
jgi:glucose/arabinose dehydrogenase